MRAVVAILSPIREFGVLTSSIPSSMTLIADSLVPAVEFDEEPMLEVLNPLS